MRHGLVLDEPFCWLSAILVLVGVLPVWPHASVLGLPLQRNRRRGPDHPRRPVPNGPLV